MNTHLFARSLVVAASVALVLWGASCGAFRSSIGGAPVGKDGQANQSAEGGIEMAKLVGRATVGSLVRQPVSNAKLGLAVLVQRTVTAVRGSAPFLISHADPRLPAPGTEAFEQLLDKKRLPQRSLGTMEYFVDGEAFFPVFEEEVRNATKSIDLQIYIFDNDDVGVRCADLLSERSKEIPVRVLMDDVGTTAAHSVAPKKPREAGFNPPKHIANYIRKTSNIPVRRIANPWIVLDHTKLLIFDEDTAMLGGMNLGREYRSEWHDMMFRVRGPITKVLQPEFELAWRMAGPWGDLGMLTYRAPKSKDGAGAAVPKGAIHLRPLRTDAGAGRSEVFTASLTALRAAKRRIWIECPYHGNDPFLDELLAAARRGVDVRFIIPHKGNYPPINADNLQTARRLMAAGAKVYRYPRMSHLKAMIVDDWATLGASNYDTNSLLINRELNLAFSDRAAIAELERQVFLPDFKEARLFRFEETYTPFPWFMETLTDQL